jgi:hypothetical protein
MLDESATCGSMDQGNWRFTPMSNPGKITVTLFENGIDNPFKITYAEWKRGIVSEYGSADGFVGIGHYDVHSGEVKYVEDQEQVGIPDEVIEAIIAGISQFNKFQK